MMRNFLARDIHFNIVFHLGLVTETKA